MPEKFPKLDGGASEEEKLTVERKNKFLKEFLTRTLSDEEQKYHREISAPQKEAFTDWVKTSYGGEIPFTPHQKHWDSWLLNRENKAPFLDILRENLKGGTLVDLGGGQPLDVDGASTMVRLSRKVEMGKYISVDSRLAGYQPQKTDEVIKEDWDYYGKIDTGNTEVFAVQTDMLDFVSRIPDNSTNFVMNGIDASVLSEREYAGELAKQVMRATKVGGLIWGTESIIREFLVNARNFEMIRTQPEEKDDGEEFCFRKLDAKS